jgi:hypothetical protein
VTHGTCAETKNHEGCPLRGWNNGSNGWQFMNVFEAIFRFLGWEEVVKILSALVTVFSALLTPIIGAIAVNIAYQQHVTNRRQLRLSLFERRLKVFDSSSELIGTVLGRGKVGNDDLFKFLRETRENEFLFGPDIAAYLHELYGKASDVYALEGATDEEPKKQRVATLLWFSGQGDKVKKKFGKYMAFPDAF